MNLVFQRHCHLIAYRPSYDHRNRAWNQRYNLHKFKFIVQETTRRSVNRQGTLWSFGKSETVFFLFSLIFNTQSDYLNFGKCSSTLHCPVKDEM